MHGLQLVGHGLHGDRITACQPDDGCAQITLCCALCDLMLGGLACCCEYGQGSQLAVTGSEDSGTITGFGGLQRRAAGSPGDVRDPSHHAGEVHPLRSLGTCLKVGGKVSTVQMVGDALSAWCPVLPGYAGNGDPLSKGGFH